MKHQWKKVLPHPVLLVLFCIFYIATYKFIPTGVSHVPQIRWATAMMRVSILAMGLALHGYCRVRAFHPSFNSAYRQWLCRTPWSIEKPLPNGPAHLIWIDFVILFLATVLAYVESYSIIPPENISLAFVDSSFLIPMPAIAFFTTYLFLLLFSFDFEHFSMPLMIFLLVPFVVYPHRKPYIALIVLIAFYIMLYIALRKYLGNFPWNTSYWKTDQIKIFKKDAIAQRVIGWPLTALNVFPELKIKVSEALFISVFATWWLHAIRWTFQVSSLSLSALLLVFVCAVSIGRALLYTASFHPPISLWGRMANGRFIIPGYDKVFLAPICTLIVGLTIPVIFRRLGMNPVWNIELTFFITLFLVLALPPQFDKWRLTGAHRIALPSKSNSRTRATNRPEQTLARLFTEQRRHSTSG